MKEKEILSILLYFSLCPLWQISSAGEPRFGRTVIDADFPGGYQVEVADVNGDGKPDVVGVGGSTCAWYENPSWKKRVITDGRQTPGIISSATADLDGDGKAEVAIAFEFEMNRPKRGKLGLAVQGKTPEDPWDFKLVEDMLVPSIHRLRWGDVNGDKKPELVIAPIFSPGASPPKFDQLPARLAVAYPGEKPTGGDWSIQLQALADGRPIVHAIEVVDTDGDGRADILTASNAGVTRYRFLRTKEFSSFGPPESLIPGAPGEAPKRGSSEVHLGKFKDGTRFLATIDPWHGSQVAVCLEEKPGSMTFGPRSVLDDTLDDGHALWVADIDGDGDDEILAGHRGRDARVSAFDHDRASKTWTRTVIDRQITAQDLRGGDLDGDGTPDVVAIGGRSHNLVWYRPLREK